MTVGDWQVRIWSEDVKESPIMWTKYVIYYQFRIIYTSRGYMCQSYVTQLHFLLPTLNYCNQLHTLQENFKCVYIRTIYIMTFNNFKLNSNFEKS